jgi:hypothetical protein
VQFSPFLSHFLSSLHLYFAYSYYFNFLLHRASRVFILPILSRPQNTCFPAESRALDQAITQLKTEARFYVILSFIFGVFNLGIATTGEVVPFPKH